jgi:predicted DNA-binding antitoxin AbrB/MazE fold protein
MPLIIEAVYEDGVLKPVAPLPLREHERVRATLEPHAPTDGRWRPLIDCKDGSLVEQAALDPELDYY